MARNIADIRNLVICGHGSAGKTTLVDALLVKTGAVQANPSVDAGTSICDFDEEEKHHKHSIEATVAHFDHAGKRVNLIDTPGYPELVGQMIGSLRAAENALIAIDAHSGIKVNTRRAWDEAGKAGCGRIIVLTKLDTGNNDLGQLVSEIKEVFGQGCALLNVPLGMGDDLHGVASTLSPPKEAADAAIDPQEIHEALVESIIESDEALMERYFEGEMPSNEELGKLMSQAIAAGTLTPIVCLSTKKDVGVDELLDVITMAALPPDAVERKAKKDGDEVTLKQDPGAPLAAQVFKTRIDPFVQRLSFVRVYAGTLHKDDMVHVSGVRKDVKIGGLLEVQASETTSIDEVGAGDIAAVAKCEDMHTGTSLGDVELPPLKFPTPMIGLAVSPKARGDEAKLSGALHKLTEEDPTIHLEHDAETKEMVLTGMSELQLQLVQERLKRRDHVEIETHEPKIPYRETVQSNGDGMYRHKKQSGGAGQFGEVHLRMYPLPADIDPETYATKDRFPQLKNSHYFEDSNFLWIDSIVGGSIPGNFMPAVEKGLLERMKQGVVAGYPIQNVCVEVHFGKSHAVDSNETAFKIAASKAFAEVFKKCKPSLLEPMVNLHITVPADNVGDVSSDLSGRRGQMMGMDNAPGGLTTVEAKAPLAEVATYARTLSSMTGGQGSFTMEFSNYEVVPGNVQQDIIANAKLKEEED
ncbi:MAG: GTP-binding protein [Planctomycetaceae bacterium]|nr:GTP-binding protein [Planctomycetaceae bacterium]